jgi:hypothetical protein
VWEYEVVDARKDEFEDAARNSHVIREIEVVDDSETTPEDATSVALSQDEFPGPERSAEDTEKRTGAGVSATPDDGPAGRPTVDPSAGGMAARGRPYFGDDEVEGIGEPGSGGLEDLRVTDENDPSLGLTKPGDPGADPIADTGPTKTAGGRRSKRRR